MAAIGFFRPLLPPATHRLPAINAPKTHADPAGRVHAVNRVFFRRNKRSFKDEASASVAAVSC